VSYPRVYLEGWAVFEAFRRLGFKNEEIGAIVGRSPEHGPDTFHLVLASQGKKFTYTVLPIDRPFDEAVAFWNSMFEDISSGSVKDDALLEMWRASRMGSDEVHFATLVMLLQEKGFRIPALEN